VSPNSIIQLIEDANLFWGCRLEAATWRRGCRSDADYRILWRIIVIVSSAFKLVPLMWPHSISFQWWLINSLFLRPQRRRLVAAPAIVGRWQKDSNVGFGDKSKGAGSVKFFSIGPQQALIGESGPVLTPAILQNCKIRAALP